MNKKILFAVLCLAALIVALILIFRPRIPALDADPINRDIVNLIPDPPTPGFVPPASVATANALTAALGAGDSALGVKVVGNLNCAETGCRQQVEYPDEAAFKEFDRNKYDGKNSRFEQWRAGSGHTRLLRSGDERLVATWFFLTPKRRESYNPDRKEQGK